MKKLILYLLSMLASTQAVGAKPTKLKNNNQAYQCVLRKLKSNIKSKRRDNKNNYFEYCKSAMNPGESDMQIDYYYKV